MKHLILPLLLLLSLHISADNKTRQLIYEGYLGPDSIHFRLDLEEDIYEGFTAGETTYFRKNGKAARIKVWGRGLDVEINNTTCHSIILTEFNGTKICGMFAILIDKNNLSIKEGCWTHNDKVLNMFDVNQINLSHPSNYLYPVNIDRATGVYKFTYDSGNPTMPEYGGTLELYTERGNVAYSACQVTPNIADTNGKMPEFWQNQFYFYAGDIYYLCYTYKGAAFVVRNRWTDKGQQNDAFGHNADIVGIYIATNERPSEVVMTQFDEEKKFAAEHLPCSIFDLNDAWIEAVGGETTYPDEVITTDIDGDGIKEIIARYTPDRTDKYEVSGKRQAIFMYEDGTLKLVAKTEGDLEDLSIADRYVIKTVRTKNNSRTTDFFQYLFCGDIQQVAKMTKANINSYTINEKTVSEKEFKKTVKYKNRKNVEDMDGWITIPDNVFRNEHCARG